MNWKEFFKPNEIKIVLTVIFFLVSIIIFKDNFTPQIYVGFPLLFYLKSFGDMVNPGPDKIIYQNLFIDLILWYLLSCLIMFIYEKYVKRGRK